MVQSNTTLGELLKPLLSDIYLACVANLLWPGCLHTVGLFLRRMSFFRGVSSCSVYANTDWSRVLTQGPLVLSPTRYCTQFFSLTGSSYFFHYGFLFLWSRWSSVCVTLNLSCNVTSVSKVILFCFGFAFIYIRYVIGWQNSSAMLHNTMCTTRSIEARVAWWYWQRSASSNCFVSNESKFSHGRALPLTLFCILFSECIL